MSSRVARRPYQIARPNTPAVAFNRPSRALGASSIQTLRSFCKVLKEYRDVPAFLDDFDHAALSVCVWNGHDCTARNVGDVHPGSGMLHANDSRFEAIADHERIVFYSKEH